MKDVRVAMTLSLVAGWVVLVVTACGGSDANGVPIGSLSDSGTTSSSGSSGTSSGGTSSGQLYRGIRAGILHSWNYSSTTPSPIGLESSWRAVSSNAEHFCAIRNDDTLACAGANTNGQIGDGTTQTRPSLTDVGLGGWQTIATGGSHTCGLRNGGELYCWGANNNGQIGDGSLYSTVPVATQ